MKKILLACTAVLVAYGINSPISLANDHWFNNWDRDRDGHLNYEEFCAAHRDWELHHHKKSWDDARLRSEFAHWDHDHDGALQAKEAAEWHHHR